MNTDPATKTTNDASFIRQTAAALSSIHCPSLGHTDDLSMVFPEVMERLQCTRRPGVVSAPQSIHLRLAKIPSSFNSQGSAIRQVLDLRHTC